MLDLESVRLFVLVAECGNLTRAAEAAGTAQPVVSQRLKALEGTLGRRLLDRTPRFVRLTGAGGAFLEHARRLLAAHDAAVAPALAPAATVALGLSEHALGVGFERVLRRSRSILGPDVLIKVRLGSSQDIRTCYETGGVDLAVLRREGRGGDGDMLGEDPLEWRAPLDWTPTDGPLPLVTLAPPCAVRAVAEKALERAGVECREAFVGGSCLALGAAVRAGLGVAPVGRMVGQGMADTSAASGLPPLPASHIVMLARTSNATLSAAARALETVVRDILRTGRA